MKNKLLSFLFFLMLIISFDGGILSAAISKDSIRYLNHVFEKVDIQKDIVFGEVTNFNGKKEKLLLDVYKPFGDNQTGRPVIMWLHGGGFKTGNDKSQSYIVKLSTEFAERGYVCVSINYRVRINPTEDKKGTLFDAMEDAMSGLNWIRNNSVKLNIDRSKIIVGGGSAGGMIAVNFCFKDNTPSKQWDKSGIIGLVDLWGSPDESYTVARVDESDPPTIIVHGTADKTVSYTNSLKLVNELKINNVKHELVPIEGAGHTPISHWDQFGKNIAEFLYGLILKN
jgi:acetyl esterase/lipase